MTTVTLVVTDDLGVVNSDTVAVTVSLSQTPAGPLPVTTGSRITVNLPDPGAVWRLTSEFVWHGDGQSIFDVVAGETYQVEALPYVGAVEVVNTLVTAGVGETVVDLDLLVPPVPSETGVLRFPETAQGFSWRFTGESVWRDVADDGDLEEDFFDTVLPVGTYQIEFRPVTGYATPSPREVTVSESVAVGLNWGGYLRIDNFDAGKTFEVQNSPNLAGDPFQYVGMIRSPLGRGSGTVVAPRVVLTAAHLFFDFRGLQWPEVEYFARQQEGERQAPPRVPRGILYRTSYAKLVAPDSVPGTVADLPDDDQEVDFAVLYFSSASTWEEGSANFVQSTAEQNWLTGTESKWAVGYPQRSQPYAERGKMFEKTFSTALSPLDTNDPPLLYETAEVFGDGGASGSALFVGPAGTGNHYPAAVLLAGQGRAVYRIIDGEVTRMIKDGEDAASGNDAVLDSNSSLVSFSNLGSFTTIAVEITPAEVLGEARWTLTSNTGGGVSNLLPSQQMPFNETWDSFTITLSPVAGYSTPGPLVFTSDQIQRSAMNTISIAYATSSPYETWKALNGVVGDLEDEDGDNVVALAEYALDTDPSVSDRRAGLRVGAAPGPAGVAEFEVYVSGFADGVVYTVLVADSVEALADGTNVEVLGVLSSADAPGGVSGYVTVSDAAPVSTSGERFARVEYSLESAP